VFLLEKEGYVKFSKGKKLKGIVRKVDSDGVHVEIEGAVGLIPLEQVNVGQDLSSYRKEDIVRLASKRYELGNVVDVVVQQETGDKVILSEKV
jgi:ribosomal protein S1